MNYLFVKAIKANITLDWLFAVPLYNFMKGVSLPYMEPQYELESIKFLKGFPRLPRGLVSEFNVYNYSLN